MSKNESRHPKGYWMSVGISIGIAIGAALSPIFDNFGTGIGFVNRHVIEKNLPCMASRMVGPSPWMVARVSLN